MRERLGAAAEIRRHFAEVFSRHGGGALDVLGAGVRSVAARLRYADVDACGHADVVGPRREVPVRVVLAAAALQLLVRRVERLSDRLVRPVQRYRSRHRVQRLPPYVHTVFQKLVVVPRAF